MDFVSNNRQQSLSATTDTGLCQQRQSTVCVSNKRQQSLSATTDNNLCQQQKTTVCQQQQTTVCVSNNRQRSVSATTDNGLRRQQKEKTIIKTLSKKKWKQQHPNSNQSDSFHKLNRPEQVILFRLRTGHNRLNAHMYNKFKVDESGMCPCNTDIMTAEHLLQAVGCMMPGGGTCCQNRHY